jgi:hypothetical protein
MAIWQKSGHRSILAGKLLGAATAPDALIKVAYKCEILGLNKGEKIEISPGNKIHVVRTLSNEPSTNNSPGLV